MKRRQTLLRSAAICVAIAVLGFVGCKGTCGGGKKKGEDEPKPTGEARVELLKKGSEPRVTMQIGRWTGFRYTIVLETDSSLGLQGQKPIRPPTVVSTIRIRTTRGTADPIERKRGDRVLKLVEEMAVLDSVEAKSDILPPEFVKQLNAGLSAVAGSETRQLVAEDGEIVEVQTRRVGGVDPAPEVKKVLDQAWNGAPRFPFRLPPAEVGVGARWRFSERVKSNDVDVVQVSDMIVQSIDEDRVAIKLRARQQASPQDFADPFNPGQTARLDRFRGDGEGNLTMDRLTGVPLEGRFSTTATLTVSA